MAKFNHIRLDSVNPSEDLNTKDHAARMTKILKELYKNRNDKNARIEIIQETIMLYIKKFIDNELVLMDWNPTNDYNQIRYNINNVVLLDYFEKFVKWGSYKRIYRRSHRWQNLMKFIIPFILGVAITVISGLILYFILR